MVFRLLMILVLCVPISAHALLPPDLIVSVGSNLLQILGLVVLGVTVVYSVVLVAAKQGFLVLKKNVLVLLLIGNLLAGAVLYFFLLKQEETFFSQGQTVEQLRIENALLKNSVSAEIVSASSSVVLSKCGVEGEAEEACTSGKKFYGETFVVQGNDIILEFDINQIEVGPNSGVFVQHLYLNGSVHGTSVSEYSKTISTSTILSSQSFLRHFSATAAYDLSPKVAYEMTFIVQGEPVRVSISEVQGDFISRAELTHTRIHSSGVAKLTIAGVEESANVYVEKIYSSDVHDSIFFPGYDAVDSKTAQFVLWDDKGQFYLFDVTDVKNAPPQYRSHIWLLKKDDFGKAEKAYVGSYHEITTSLKLSWELQMPGFDDAQITLIADDLYKGERGRIRAKVSGVISDNSGERSIHGVAHIVD